MIKVLRSYLSASFLRYIIVGVSSLAGDYITFLTLYYAIKFPLSVSVTLGLLVGIVINFSLNKYWAFSSKSQQHHYTLIKQLIYYGLLLVLNSLFTYYFVNFLQQQGIKAGFGKLIATCFITAWNYLIYKLAIFKQKDPTELI